MVNFIIIAVVAVILGMAIYYIVKEKKKGTKCIGCPAAGQCAQLNQCNSECGCHTGNA